MRVHLALDDLHRTLRQRTDLSSRELKVPDTISKLDAESFRVLVDVYSMIDNLIPAFKTLFTYNFFLICVLDIS